MDPLLSVEELVAELAGSRPTVLLDVRWRLSGPPGRSAYSAGHLPGAVFCDLDADLSGPPGPAGRHPLPDPERLQEALRRLGVHAGDLVVAYDDADSTIAARAWWTLRWAGLSDVRVLDGGLAAWVASGRPLSTDEPTPEAGDVVVRPGQLPVLDAAGAAELAATGILLDARAAERHRGEVEPIDPVAGHIPGAVSAPTVDNVTAAGTFLPAERLRERFAALGVRPGTPTGAYCGSGVTAAHEVLALHMAGIPATLYVGSWSEWVADPARPVA